MFINSSQITLGPHARTFVYRNAVQGYHFLTNPEVTHSFQLLQTLFRRKMAYPNDNLLHKDPSISPVNDALLGLGGLGYTVCYILMARQSMRDRTYAMPLFSLAFNFAWEIVFASFVSVELEEKVIYIIWMLADMSLVYAVVVYGANEWKHAPAVARNIGKIFALMLAWWCVSLYAICAWWLDPTNPVNPKLGKVYKGVEGIDKIELGFWTALAAQVVLSVMSLGQIIVRGTSGGSSYTIWATRFIGSVGGLNLNYLYGWWVWPKEFAYVVNSFAVIMMVTWFLADLAYVVVLYNVKQTEMVLPDGRKMKVVSQKASKTL